MQDDQPTRDGLQVVRRVQIGHMTEGHRLLLGAVTEGLPEGVFRLRLEGGEDTTYKKSIPGSTAL